MTSREDQMNRANERGEMNTEVREWTWIDRAALRWPSGPWDGEPDKVHWKDEATGMDCLAVRNPRRGNWCGYVAVTEGHPSFGKDYGEVDADVHGGLTFADFSQETEGPQRGICHVPFPGEPDRVWWLGFDCAHAWDYSPDDQMRSDNEGGIWQIMPDSSYRTLDYVKSECRSLASQLAEPTHDPNELPQVVTKCDELLAAQGRLMFARENYDEAAATDFGVQLLDFFRLHGEKIRAALSTLTAQGGEDDRRCHCCGESFDRCRETYRGERDKPLPSEPFGHYFRAMDGSQHFHTGAQVPSFAQSEITPLYTTPPAPSSSAVEGLVARLQKTVSDLGEHRQTHVVWRDWLQKSPDNEKVNPHAGSAEFHAGVILDYDRHLANINDAIQALASTAASGGDELPDVACADGTLVPGWIAANIARISAWFRENGSENWHVCGIGPIAEPPGGYMLVRKAVVNFLDGSGPLNGYWFDQTVPGKPYWWRKYLHEQPLAASAQGDGDGK